MKGIFSGTFEITGHGTPVRPVLGAVVAVVVLSWLATVLWLLAAVLAATVALTVPALVLVHRYNRRETEKFLVRAEVLRGQSAAEPQVAASAPREVHYHTHLHVGSGADAAAIIRKALIEGAVTEEN